MFIVININVICPFSFQVHAMILLMQIVLCYVSVVGLILTNSALN